MISAILIQGQRILVSVDNGAKIQNEVRTALLKIQTEAQKADEVIISNKFGVFYGNKWILSDSSNSARELLRVINNEDDNVRVYVEVNDGDKHQLVEFIIDELTNEMVNMMSTMRNFQSSQSIFKMIDGTLDLAANSIGKV